ncbi:MAG: FAD-dependent oxidoreductase [Pseudomonas sp.]|uniref:NAD(P)/FAD-dependent oxidoreductase n=1 Tax=Pseudomonas sp. TaxID=306 RepID=UPI0033970D44
MQQHILIIGAGFGGLWSALSAARLLDLHGNRQIAITLLAPQAALQVRPRFYEANPASLSAPLEALFDAVGVNFVQGLAVAIDSLDQHVRYRDARGVEAELRYDRLILAAGSQVNRPALPGIEEFAFDVDRLDSAVELERHLHRLRELPDSPARNTLVVAGGGFTGIETATELPARLKAILGEDTQVQVVVVDTGSRIGEALGSEIAPLVAQASEQLGIHWRLGLPVVAVDAGGVTLQDGSRIPTKTLVWTVGVNASPLTRQIEGERDRQGRLHVDSRLKVVGQSAVFATGDTAYAALDDQGNHALMSCQHAIALGRYAGHNAVADLLGLPPLPYRQPKYVTCLDLGGYGAVFSEGWERKVLLTGADGKQLKTQINTQWIYPPAADRASALAAADPLIPVVA